MSSKLLALAGVALAATTVSTAAEARTQMRAVGSSTVYPFAKIVAERFRWLKGDDLLSAYETSPGIGWAFCRICGSSLGIPNHGKLSEITLGSLDSDPGVRPTEHIFVGSKAAWYEITDALPQHHTWPPGRAR